MARERGQTNKNVSGGSEQKKNADRCTEEPKQETEDNGSNFFVFFNTEMTDASGESRSGAK